MLIKRPGWLSDNEYRQVKNHNIPFADYALFGQKETPQGCWLRDLCIRDGKLPYVDLIGPKKHAYAELPLGLRLTIYLENIDSLKSRYPKYGKRLYRFAYCAHNIGKRP